MFTRHQLIKQVGLGGIKDDSEVPTLGPWKTFMSLSSQERQEVEKVLDMLKHDKRHPFLCRETIPANPLNTHFPYSVGLRYVQSPQKCLSKILENSSHQTFCKKQQYVIFGIYHDGLGVLRCFLNISITFLSFSMILATMPVVNGEQLPSVSRHIIKTMIIQVHIPVFNPVPQRQ